MTGTTGYQAGVESNDVLVSYAQEAAYGVLPAVVFQAVRLTGETLAGTKQRSRPNEINTTGEVSGATTQQESAGGNVNFALSYGTYDDLLAGAFRSDWQISIAVNGVAGDITVSTTAVNGVATLTSATAGKFTGISAGGAWIRVGGFAQAAANGYFRVTANTGLVLSFLTPLALTAETPTGTAAQVRSSSMTNSTTVKTFRFQKRLTSALFLNYPGSYVSAFSLTGGVGQFLSGSFTVMGQQEFSATTDSSTGAVLAASTGGVHDAVGGFGGTYLDGLPIAATVDSFNLSVTATGAKQEYGMGSAAAAGQIAGLAEVKGQVKIYFKDFTLYARFKNETRGCLSFITRDPAGNAYVISVLSAALMNPNVTASGPSTAVMATFQVEGNPRSVGGSVQIDRLTAA